MAPSFPDSRLRRGGLNSAQVRDVSTAWTAAAETDRADFAEAIAGVPDREVAAIAGQFLTGASVTQAASEQVQQPQTVAAAPDPGAPADNGGDDSDGDGSDHDREGTDDTAGTGGDDGSGDTTSGDQTPAAPDVIAAALQTRDTATAHLAEHPEDREAMLAAERAGKARKTVIALLEQPTS